MRRRALPVILGALVALLPAAVAHAGSETPQGQLKSPTRAVGGQPIFVRSITPCPAVGAPYEWVNVWITPQSDPTGEGDYTRADLRDDRSWEVTLSAPDDFPDGVTKSYAVHAQCVRHDNPYYAPDTGTSDGSSSDGDVARSYFRYFYRPLTVTAPPDGGMGSAAAVEDAEDDTSTTTTTQLTTTTTEPDVASAGLYAASFDNNGEVVNKIEGDTWVDDEAERAAEARAELARRGVDTSDMSDDEVLLASPVAAHRTVPDAGIPWWSFVLATMLAVAAVIAWGTRRERALVE